MVETLILREAIAVIGSALAAKSDIKTGLIFDEVTYPMILLGALFNAAEFNLMAFLVAGTVFAAGYAMYVGGKIGGGDVKLFTGLALLVPFLGNNVFVVNVFVISGFAAIFYFSVYYLLKYAKKGINFEENKKSTKKAAVLALILAAYMYFGLSSGLFSQKFAAIIGVFGFCAIIFVALEKGIKKEFFLKKIRLEELEEDDIIALEFLDEKTSKGLSLNFKGIVDQKTGQKLKELKQTHVSVYRNLPKFAPFVLLGVVAAIIFPDIFSVVFS